MKNFINPWYKMPFRRRYGKKRVARRRAGVYRRKRIGRRSGWGPQGGLYITRKLPLMALSSTNAGTAQLFDPTTTCLSVGSPVLSTGWLADVYDIPFTLKFQLNQLSESGDVTSIADQYKLLAAYLRIYYNNSGVSSSATNPHFSSMPFVQYITDHDDGTLPTMQRLRAKMGVKMATFKNSSSYIGIKCRPRPSMEIYSSGTAYAVPNSSLWIDCTDDDVPHYAIKGFLTQVPLVDTAEGLSVFTFDVALKVACKGIQ